VSGNINLSSSGGFLSVFDPKEDFKSTIHNLNQINFVSVAKVCKTDFQTIEHIYNEIFS